MGTITVENVNYHWEELLVSGVKTKCLVPEKDLWYELAVCSNMKTANKDFKISNAVHEFIIIYAYGIGATGYTLLYMNGSSQYETRIGSNYHSSIKNLVNYIRNWTSEGLTITRR